MSYPTVRLGTVAYLDREGVNPATISAATNYVGLEHISSDGSFANTAKVEPGDLASTKFAFSEKHVLFGKLRPYLRKTARPNFSGICSTDIIPIVPSERLSRDFLFHYLRTDQIVSRATSMSSGVNLPRISPSHLINFDIPLPPLDEQRRIAAILDQADTLRRKRRDALQTLELLRRSTFDDLFGDPVTNFKGWPVGRIADVTSTTQYGTSSKAGAVGTFPILRMGNITSNGAWKLDDLKFINFEQKEIGKYTVKPGDILFNRTNSPDLVGKTAVFREAKTYGFAGYLVRLRLNEQADPEYVSAYLNSTHGKATLRGMCKSIIGMANINAKELISIPLLLPPIALQKRYAAIVSGILETERQNTAHLEELNRMFGVLQHRAFRGEL